MAWRSNRAAGEHGRYGEVRDPEAPDASDTDFRSGEGGSAPMSAARSRIHARRLPALLEVPRTKRIVAVVGVLIDGRREIR